jgi:hypothetical protein
MRRQLPSSISRSSVQPRRVKEDFIDPFDQCAVAVQLHRVHVKPAF